MTKTIEELIQDPELPPLSLQPGPMNLTTPVLIKAQGKLIVSVPDMQAYDRFCDAVLYADDNMRKFRTLLSRKRSKQKPNVPVKGIPACMPMPTLIFIA